MGGYGEEKELGEEADPKGIDKLGLHVTISSSHLSEHSKF